MGMIDRLLTIVVTATITSGAWVVFGSSLVGRAEQVQADQTRPAPTVVADVSQGGPLQIPVQGVTAEQLTDTFAQERDEGARSHQAIDIVAAEGTPVLAAAEGTVEKLFTSDAGGLTIYVRPDDRRTMHYYAHLQGYVAGLAEGQRFSRGQQIGTVGVSGNAASSGPHLHFAVFQTAPDAAWYDPAPAINPYPLMIAD